LAEQEWFSEYYWLTQITSDRGNELIYKDSQSLIKMEYGVEGKSRTVRKFQANAFVGRGQSNYLNEDTPGEEVLSATAFTVRPTFVDTGLQRHSRTASV
jgi:hypothetical protein